VWGASLAGCAGREASRFIIVDLRRVFSTGTGMPRPRFFSESQAVEVGLLRDEVSVGTLHALNLNSTRINPHALHHSSLCKEKVLMQSIHSSITLTTKHTST
jgi:hypothetical protein